jgi:L-glyceraldehyde 3-phosphate reductase
MRVMERRFLGSSGIEVSPISLGSWRTFERLPRETGVAIMQRARECGIDFFDDARYDDETGTAPLKTGYSEVVFGELFRAAGIRRDEVTVANKLWWEFWPEQSAAQEVEASLDRMGFDHLDVIYSFALPAGLEVGEAVAGVAAVLAAGTARAWGVANWSAEAFAEAIRAAGEQGIPPPAAAQLPYSLVERSWVEDEEMVAALEASKAGLVPSYVLAGGALTGKYEAPGASGRVADELGEPRVQHAVRAGRQLRALAQRLDATPAALAIAFTLANPRTASTLVGATSPEQVAANAEAPAVLARLSADELGELRAIGSG